MSLEDVDNIADLVETNPTSGDPKSSGDNHIRLLKRVLLRCFPNIKGPMVVAHDQVASKQDIANAQFDSALPMQSQGFLHSDGTTAGFSTTHTGYAQNEVKGANVASAATLDLTQPGGNFVHVTGTAAITAITVPVGADRALVFDAALTLTNGAGLLLPTGANIVTQPGDRAIVRGDTGGAIVTHYQRASGMALVYPAVPPPTYALLGSAVISSPVATINFLTAITAEYDRIVIEISGVNPTTAAGLQIRMANGGTLDSSSSYFTPVADGAASSTVATSATVAPSSAVGLPDYTLTVSIRNAQASTARKGIGVYGSFLNTGFAVLTREGYYAGAGPLSGFQLFWSNGTTFASGTVRVYGMRNA